MGSTTLRSKPTIHNGSLNNMYKSQQPDRSNTTSSKESYAESDLTSYDDRSRSPVSPIESNGETWKYPPRANAHLKGLGTLYEIPLDEAPKDHFRSRPMSYYDGMPTSPEPEGKAVFADLPAAPAKKRLSRPFEQPYPVHKHGLTLGQGQASAPPVAVSTQANMSRADSHLRHQPAQSAHPSAAPAPLAIPTPAHHSRRQRPAPLALSTSAHQSRRQREPSPYQEDQAPTQRSARHQGWNPLEEPPRQQRTANAHHQDRRRENGRGEDLEWQAGLARLNNRSKHNDPQYKSGRRCFFFLLIMMILVIVIIVVMVEKYMHSG